MSDPNVVVARNTDQAPVSDLYSQTVAFSHYNNLSAQLPIDPATGAIVAGGAAEQAEQCFKNLQAIVESIGHDMNDIIRVSIFLADIMDLNAVEKVQASFFPTYQPARTVAAVDALPQGALVFIEALVDNGAMAVFEGANMPLTPEAIETVQKNGLLYSPGKASNAGGVATSGLEMSQNSIRMSWSFEEVDEKLHGIMQNIYKACYDASVECGRPGDLMVGANVAGFLKVAEAMMAQGIV